MTARKTERLMGLLIMLLVQRRPVPKNAIRHQLYDDLGDAAFEKKFERDKEDLRSLGVPIEVAPLDAYFDDEVGYRIRADEFQLPEIGLEADEASVLALAGKVWQNARLAQATTDAVHKLAAAGLDPDPAGLDVIQAAIGAMEPAFPVVWEATVTRTPLSFSYAGPGRPAATRQLEPWGVVRVSGRWYVAGLDTDRGEERVFRLSRIQGEARLAGSPGAYVVPDGTDPSEVARRLVPSRSEETATVLVRSGTSASLRRLAHNVAEDVEGPDDSTGWDRLLLSGSDIVGDVLACGPDAFVESPDALRDLVVSRLRQATGAQA